MKTEFTPAELKELHAVQREDERSMWHRIRDLTDENARMRTYISKLEFVAKSVRFSAPHDGALRDLNTWVEQNPDLDFVFYPNRI